MRTITSIITATYFVGPTVTVTNTVTGTSRATGDDDDLETTTVESTVLATITISPGKIVSGPPSDEAKGKKKRGSSGAIIGGVIGGVIGCALLIVGAVWWRKRKHQEQRGEKPHGGPWQFRSGGARGGGSHRGIVRLMMRDEDGAGANSPLAPAGAAKSNGTAVTHQESMCSSRIIIVFPLIY